MVSAELNRPESRRLGPFGGAKNSLSALLGDGTGDGDTSACEEQADPIIQHN